MEEEFEREEFVVICSVYLSPLPPNNNGQTSSTVDDSLTVEILENILKSCSLRGKYKLLKTRCGFLISLSQENDVNKIMKSLPPILNQYQIVRLNGKKMFSKHAVFLREVPWAIQLNDLVEALNRQGITAAHVERKRHHVRVEVCEPEHYDMLLRKGLNFFGAIRFQAIPDRGARSHSSWHNPITTLSSDPNYMLQCYRCQGFWHVAADCKQEIRCVRCGEHHSVVYCPRSRSDAICCHCSGPHHAAYKYCPVRLDLVNALPVSMTLSTSKTPLLPF